VPIEFSGIYKHLLRDRHDADYSSRRFEQEEVAQSLTEAEMLVATVTEKVREQLQIESEDV
jgi:uncharacterized protein (UPF0332 family)